MRRVAESILAGQNISSDFLCHTYTADIEREIYGQVFIGGITITGSSTRTGWIDVQVEGSGTTHVGVPVTDATMVTGTTVNGIYFTSLPMPVYTGDIVKFYIKGTAADTSAYVRTRVFDMNALRPTVDDRTLDVSATGEAGLDFNNIKDASTEHQLVNIIVPRTTVITDGYVTVSGTVDANIKSSDNIDFTTLQKASLNAATPVSVGAVTGNVNGDIIGNISGTAEAIRNGYVSASGTVSITDPLLATVPGSYAGGTAGYALGRIGGGQITTTSIVAQSGNVTTYRGDDYNNTDGRRIDWTDSSASWPTLTAATILIVIGGDISFAGTVITATGASKKVGVELTAAQTSTIPQGELDFVVRATLSSGRIVTLLEGKWTSKKQLVVGS